MPRVHVFCVPARQRVFEAALAGLHAEIFADWVEYSNIANRAALLAVVLDPTDPFPGPAVSVLKM